MKACQVNVAAWEVFQVEGTANAKVLGQEGTWPTWSNNNEASMSGAG